MSKEGYGVVKKESDNKVVLEKLQSYLKDKKSGEALEGHPNYSKPGTSYDYSLNPIQHFDDGSNILREILNYKKAALLRDPETVQVLNSFSSNLSPKDK